MKSISEKLEGTPLWESLANSKALGIISLSERSQLLRSKIELKNLMRFVKALRVVVCDPNLLDSTGIAVCQLIVKSLDTTFRHLDLQHSGSRSLHFLMCKTTSILQGDGITLTDLKELVSLCEILLGELSVTCRSHHVYINALRRVSTPYWFLAERSIDESDGTLYFTRDIESAALFVSTSYTPCNAEAAKGVLQSYGVELAVEKFVPKVPEQKVLSLNPFSWLEYPEKVIADDGCSCSISMADPWNEIYSEVVAGHFWNGMWPVSGENLVMVSKQ